jgi:hypothetical protein
LPPIKAADAPVNPNPTTEIVLPPPIGPEAGWTDVIS